ncbi:Helix-turn-helix [Catalinimonas alkaloidigena]|uniref:Helix-turn-helix n=1 Tax=Catalinimonas alkaloidigena TaxID=1075417 RepID=A0A1G9RR70_9BACT|nr:helix-turn-helix domain-containing protein [Catalinimonas alkaloidigena]SDM25686.1 Helix-turn-helix [Catalinimonas alkaloidigena]
MSLLRANLRFLRKQHKLTQQKLADRIGIKRSLLGAYEEGRAEPREEYVARMAEVFGVDFVQLMTRDLTGGNPPPLPGSVPTRHHDDAHRSHHAAPVRNMPAPPKPSPTTYTAVKPAPPKPEPAAPTPRSDNGVAVASPKPAASGTNRYAEGREIRMLSVTVDAQQRQQIELVPQAQLRAYETQYADPAFLEGLPKMQLPSLEGGDVYRAFELDAVVVVGRYVRNWYSLQAKPYVLLTRGGRVHQAVLDNQIAETGCVQVGNEATPVESILEIWEPVRWISDRPPVSAEAGQPLSVAELTQLVRQLQADVERLKRR